MFERYQPDLDACVRRVRTGPCFVCAILARDQVFPDHHIIYEDEGGIVFLAMNPTQYGYTLVAPKEHKADDFTVEEYLGLQRVVHRVAERMYVLPLGSNQGNAHVHWHVMQIPDGEKAALAARIGQRMGSSRVDLAHR